MTRAVRDYLRERAWPDPVAGDSGNGWHLLYRIDLPNDADAASLLKKVLQALAARFDTDPVHSTTRQRGTSSVPMAASSSTT